MTGTALGGVGAWNRHLLKNLIVTVTVNNVIVIVLAATTIIISFPLLTWPG